MRDLHEFNVLIIILASFSLTAVLRRSGATIDEIRLVFCGTFPLQHKKIVEMKFLFIQNMSKSKLFWDTLKHFCIKYLENVTEITYKTPSKILPSFVADPRAMAGLHLLNHKLDY